MGIESGICSTIHTRTADSHGAELNILPTTQESAGTARQAWQIRRQSARVGRVFQKKKFREPNRREFPRGVIDIEINWPHLMPSNHTPSWGSSRKEAVDPTLQVIQVMAINGFPALWIVPLTVQFSTASTRSPPITAKKSQIHSLSRRVIWVVGHFWGGRRSRKTDAVSYQSPVFTSVESNTYPNDT